MASIESAPTSPSKPDLMNDTSYEMNSNGKPRRPEEPDTCRICRGEGSKEEPLFYPCKCSGSIKFVHQGCLMEWLSHSQKKHCELCKTSFRFTKLYHPQMPRTVPSSVFIRQAAVHTFNSFLTWARWHLVFFVWLGWVPWCMRTVWRALFWIGDGGWVNLQELQRQSFGAQEQLDKLMEAGNTLATDSLVLQKNVTASEIISRVSNVLPPLWPSSIQTSNFTGQPTFFRFAKSLFKIMFYRGSADAASPNPSISQNSSNATPITNRAPSLLSEIAFLRNLTPWTTMNKLVVDVLEGQLITLLVVVAFILIFLIREWVVQQQPAINMGEAFNAPPAAIEDQQAGVPDEPQPDQPLEVLRPRANRIDERRFARPRRANGPRARDENPAPTGIWEPDSPEQEGNPNQHPDNPFRDGPGIRDDFIASNLQELVALGVLPSDAGGPGDAGEFEPSAGSQRPGLPPRDTLSRAAEIRRTLEEHSSWPGINVFMDLWRRADSQPTEVLRIIREEDREEELEWIVFAMQRLEVAASERTEQGSQAFVVSREESAIESPPIEQQSDGSNESWQVVADADADSCIPLSSGPPMSQDDPRASEQSGSSSPSYNAVPSTLGDPNAAQDELSVRTSATLDIRQETRTDVPYAELVAPDAGIVYDSHDELKDNIHEPREDLSGPADLSRLADAITTSDIDASPPITVPPAADGADVRALDEGTRSNTRVGQPVVINDHQGYRERLFNWLWGELPRPGNAVQDLGEDDEHVVRDVGEEAPFVPIAQGQVVIPDVNVEGAFVRDAEVVQAAAEAGIDPNEVEAVEDGEDLEGVMELIGMQGPLAGLVQNGMFSAVLISMTVFCGIWVPYIAGKLFLVFLANPVSLLVKLPLRWASTLADIIIDTCIFVAACAFYWIDTAVRLAATPVGWLLPFVATVNKNKILSTTAWSYGTTAGERLISMFVTTTDSLSDSDIPVFSIIAHESLYKAEQRLANITTSIAHVGKSFFDSHSDGFTASPESWYRFVHILRASLKRVLKSRILEFRRAGPWLPGILRINPLRISLDIPQRTEPLDFSLAVWSTRDRIVTIVLGYFAFAVAGALYLRIRAAFRESQERERTEGAIADVIHQAGGVLKVVLIISIEMILFPLYCGLLLDAALLPLFENVTVASRVRFTLSSPITSLFVHWFVGTCYMFHFALFVSMCRKILRTGVLYFIRDPDDPTFHPVRDVLERSVPTQLRKIAFSALVYGALVIICLGSVIWGLTFALDGVFPIHWSSNEPVLEFPVDLLVYNFLMPLAVKFIRPSKGLHKMYDWWFRKCAKWLRLSHFMFGERRDSEEGHVIRGRWWNPLGGLRKAPPRVDEKKWAVGFVTDGRYVRTPASDQVRIPKGAHTFVDVDQEHNRLDGRPETDDGLHGRQNPLFTEVYIPPYFRLRISAFIVLIWVFAATTGVGMTIIPLMCGRRVFAFLVPSHRRMNDIYAFSIGVYLLGSPLYLLVCYRTHLTSLLKNLLHPKPSSVSTSSLLPVARNTLRYALYAVRLAYFYGAFTIVLPSLFALVMEAYVVIPLHTYFSRAENAPPTPHTIHFIQDWTLAVLYLKMAARLILWRGPTRPATALRAIVGAPHGWLNPDVRLATRAVILPATVAMVLALTVPLGLGKVLLATVMRGSGDLAQGVVYRYAYPAFAAVGLGLLACVEARAAVRAWRVRIRDELYLIGERLHNFGERRGGRRGVVERVGA